MIGTVASSGPAQHHHRHVRRIGPKLPSKVSQELGVAGEFETGGIEVGFLDRRRDDTAGTAVANVTNRRLNRGDGGACRRPRQFSGRISHRAPEIEHRQNVGECFGCRFRGHGCDRHLKAETSEATFDKGRICDHIEGWQRFLAPLKPRLGDDLRANTRGLADRHGKGEDLLEG